MAKGLGVTILSSYAVRLELELGLFHQLRVRGSPVRRLWHLLWARERILSPASQAFRRHLHASDWRADLMVPLASE